MIVILAALIGAAIGAWTARKREGTGLDMAQYAVGYGVAFGVAALVLSFIGRAIF